MRYGQGGKLGWILALMLALGPCVLGSGLAASHDPLDGISEPRVSEPALEEESELSSVHPPPSMDVSIDRSYWRANLFRRVWHDQRFLVTVWWPAELRRPQFSAPFFGAALAGAASSSSRNGRTMDLGVSDGWWDSSAEATAVSYLGDGLVLSAGLGITYLVARRRGSNRAARAASLSGEALVNTGIWSAGLKLVFRRPRPGEENAGAFFVSGGRSFPSGHTASAFAVATVFSAEFGDRRWVPWVAYGLAGLIGSSRVVLGEHFSADVVAGAVLGNSIGHMVVQRDRGARSRNESWVAPLVAPDTGTYGLLYGRSW